MINYKGQLPAVDVGKFIFAFAVVGIHIRFLDESFSYLQIIDWFLSLAVPFFFLVMGFLLQRKICDETYNEKLNIIRKRSFSLFKLFGIWLLIYFPLAIYNLWASQTEMIEWLINYLSSVIFRGESYFSWTLWFVYAAAIYNIIYYYALKIFKRKAGVLLSIFFVSVTLLSYYNFYIPSFKENFILSSILERPLGGGVYILAGQYSFMLIKRLDYRSGSILSSLCLLISGFLFLLDLPFSSLFGAFSFFIFFLCVSLRKSEISNYMTKI